MKKGIYAEITIYREQIEKLQDARRYLGIHEVYAAIRLIDLAIADIERHIANLEEKLEND